MSSSSPQWKQQFLALVKLNFLVLIRSPSSFIIGILVPVVMLGVAFGMACFSWCCSS
jgi:hypothetical protein